MSSYIFSGLLCWIHCWVKCWEVDVSICPTEEALSLLAVGDFGNPASSVYECSSAVEEMTRCPFLDSSDTCTHALYKTKRCFNTATMSCELNNSNGIHLSEDEILHTLCCSWGRSSVPTSLFIYVVFFHSAKKKLTAKVFIYTLR